MFYSKKDEKELTNKLFENPTSEYRGAPFWAWNTTLEKDEMMRQIDGFKKMGFGGFHMHARVGLDSEYLGDRFMDMVRACIDKAKENGMRAYLYDEDRWPSGTAGGFVTKTKKFRRKIASFSKNLPDEIYEKNEALDKAKPYFLSAYDIKLDDGGYLESYKRIGKDDTAKNMKRYFYVFFTAEIEWFNNQSAVDSMDKEAMEKFFDITLPAYKNKVGDEFGKTVPSIFTDEPCSAPSWSGVDANLYTNFSLENEGSEKNLFVSWSTHFEDEFKKMCGYDILDRLPEFFYQNRDKNYKVRYDYFDVRSELFVSAFADRYKEKCDELGIAFTGHLMQEDGIGIQARATAETMRFYRSFTIPGIDLLGDRVKFQTAKQAQSAKNQYGREGMMSELYGVTSWDFDFRHHKFQGDWQAALGVTFRVPHLAFLSMRGEGKRDYPASINYQSPWYEEYPLIENHFARLNTALTRGKPIVRVGVVHPAESYWVNCGPDTKTLLARDEIDADFLKITNILLKNNIDFDFICEAELPKLYRENGKNFKVGEMEYSAVILPNIQSLRKSTLEILQKFSSDGKVIVAGRTPEYIDGTYCADVKEKLAECENVTFDECGIIPALEDVREVKIDIFDILPSGEYKTENTTFDNFYIYNLRADNNGKWLFIAHGAKHDYDFCFAKNLKITVNGEYSVKVYNTLNGEISDVPFEHKNGKTICNYVLNASDSLLLRYEKTDAPSIKDNGAKAQNKLYSFSLTDAVDYTLAEPNVYIADKFDAYLDGEKAAENTEILRIDDKIRTLIGEPVRGGRYAQPWTKKFDGRTYNVKLVHKFESKIDTGDVWFATEEKGKIAFNGEQIDMTECGYFTDRDIKKYKLGKIKKGTNIIEIELDYRTKTNLEACYILGDFGVELHGADIKIVNRAEKIYFDTVTNQTLPFYGGNLTYKTEIDTPECSLEIRAHKYRGALVKVKFDGEYVGNTTFAPYGVCVKNVKSGKHTVEFELFGTRYNTFGPLHRAQENADLCTPATYRAKGDWWCEEYKVRNTGILKAPEITVFEK